MTDSIDMPPGVEAALRSALRHAFNAGLRVAKTGGTVDQAVDYGVNQVANAWMVGRLGQQQAPWVDDAALLEAVKNAIIAIPGPCITGMEMAYAAVKAVQQQKAGE